MKDLQKLVEANTKDGVVDWESIEKTINEETNNLIAKNKGSELNRVLNELGLEKVEDLKLTLKEKEELAKKLEETNKSLETINKSLEEKDKVITLTEREKMLYQMGITDKDTVDYVLFNVNKRVGEDKDFASALEEYKKEKPQFFEEKPLTISTKGNPTVPPEEKLGFEKVLEERRPDVFKK